MERQSERELEKEMLKVGQICLFTWLTLHLPGCLELGSNCTPLPVVGSGLAPALLPHNRDGVEAKHTQKFSSPSTVSLNLKGGLSASGRS